jgi:NADH-quinone oxidoreductase subunit M
MLNSFVGEFLILSGTLQANDPHHRVWTVLATTGVILSAAYMLLMIQRVFYGDLGVKAEAVVPHDLNAREHTALWPLIAMMLVMGVASPYWMHTLDHNATAMANVPAVANPAGPRHEEMETYAKPAFVDPALKGAALHETPVAAPEGRRY